MWYAEDSLRRKAAEFSVDAVGDVPVTYADVSALECELGYRLQRPREDGLSAFARWYGGHYGPQ